MNILRFTIPKIILFVKYKGYVFLYTLRPSIYRLSKPTQFLHVKAGERKTYTCVGSAFIQATLFKTKIVRKALFLCFFDKNTMPLNNVTLILQNPNKSKPLKLMINITHFRKKITQF